MQDLFNILIAIFLFVVGIAAIIYDAAANNIGWLIADIFVWPIALFRGVMYLFGGW